MAFGQELLDMHVRKNWRIFLNQKPEEWCLKALNALFDYSSRFVLAERASLLKHTRADQQTMIVKFSCKDTTALQEFCQQDAEAFAALNSPSSRTISIDCSIDCSNKICLIVTQEFMTWLHKKI